MKTKYYSPKQAAEEIGITTTAVLKAVRAGTIKADKLGWVWMIPEAEVNKLKELSVKS